MIENYIWDFDGMLFDSYPHSAMAFLKVLREDGRDGDLGEIQALLEVTIGHAMDVFSLTPRQRARFREFENDFEAAPLTVPYPNTCRVLEELAKRGGRHFLYTHRDKESAFYYLRRFHLLELFSGFVTSDDGFPSKPAPDAILYLMDQYGMDPQNTLMLGDREIDVLAGNNAGVFSCLYAPKEKETCAHFQIRDIAEVLTL